MLKLYIANKNYSSWSMRPWVLLTQKGIPFEEVMLRFDSLDAGSAFKSGVQKVSPVGKVPVLVDGELAVWDSLAITEYVAEYATRSAAAGAPASNVWPVDAKARAQARSVCAEMHAGFGALRQHCGMNIEARLPDVGAIVWRDHPAVRADVARIEGMWASLLDAYGGPFLFGSFSAADAFFAPVCMRFLTYGLPVSQRTADYVAAVAALPAVRRWIDEALAEHDFVVFDEPYRIRGNA